jgi:hypothetical protein
LGTSTITCCGTKYRITPEIKRMFCSKCLTCIYTGPEFGKPAGVITHTVEYDFDKLTDSKLSQQWTSLHEESYRSIDSWIHDTFRLMAGCRCVSHFTKYVGDNPPQGDLFKWGVRLHNSVNERLGKPVIPEELATAIWKQQPRITDFVAVTSLSILPKHLERQDVCLNSWKKFGLDIVALNSADDARQAAHYKQVDWVITDRLSEKYPRPTVLIYDLARLSIKLGKPVLLINSDIEIYGPQSRLKVQDKTLTVGIRHNYTDGLLTAEREPWGLDAFIFTPEMAETLPDLQFGIGRPMWDYWIPLHFQRKGFHMDFVGEPFFYHKAHPVHWSHEDWCMGAEWVSLHYDYDFESFADVRFRGSLPYGPKIV